MATIIRVDGTRERLEGEGPKDSRGKGKLTLEQMQAAVGGLIQPVDFPAIDADGEETFATKYIANEEGLLMGLPVNVLATVDYQDSFGRYDIGLVGDVIEIDYEDDDGNWY